MRINYVYFYNIIYFCIEFYRNFKNYKLISKFKFTHTISLSMCKYVADFVKSFRKIKTLKKIKRY